MSQKPATKILNEKYTGENTNTQCTLSSHVADEYFDAILSTLPVMGHSINREGIIEHVNDVWLKKLGYEREEVIGHKSTEFMTPQSKEYAKTEVLPQLFETGSVENVPYEFLKKDGTILHALFSANSLKDKDGLFTSSLATMFDITIRHQMEADLKKSEERYKSAQRMGKVGHWELDLKTKRMWGSHEALRIYGIKSQDTTISINKVEQCIPDRIRVHKALMDLIENKQPYDLEFDIHPFNGGTTKYVKSVAEVVVNESGIPKKVIGVVLDITVQKLADQKLRKGEEKYRQLFNSIRDSILVADTDRNIIDCNQTFTEVFGYTKKEIIGRKTNYLYDNEDEYLEMGKELKKHLNENQFTYIINYKTKSGDVVPGETSTVYLKNDKGEIVGFIGIIRNITYLKKVESSLQKASNDSKRKAVELEDMNTALEVLLKKRDKDNKELQENIYSNYSLMVTPFLNKLKNRSTKGDQQNLLDIIETNLSEIFDPFARKLSDPMMCLTSSEIQIAAMIKQGYSNKEIAALLNSSKRTVDTHRQNIRKKLQLQNEKINLKTYLMNL